MRALVDVQNVAWEVSEQIESWLDETSEEQHTLVRRYTSLLSAIRDNPWWYRNGFGNPFGLSASVVWSLV